jgi:hypothetical protein
MLLLDSSVRFPIVVAALLSACVSRAYSQNPWDCVANLPYTAHILQTSVETLPDGTQQRTEERIIKIRDSEGRTRIEIFSTTEANRDSAGDKPSMVNLYIPLRRQFIQLMPGAKKAMVTTFPGTGPIPTHANSSGTDANTVKENLPAKTINGIYATGTRTRTIMPSGDGRKVEAPYFGEYWVSPELRITVLDKHVDAHNETIDEVRQLDRSEPDPAFFEIPADYKIVNVTDGQEPNSYNGPH